MVHFTFFSIRFFTSFNFACLFSELRKELHVPTHFGFNILFNQGELPRQLRNAADFYRQSFW